MLSIQRQTNPRRNSKLRIKEQATFKRGANRTSKVNSYRVILRGKPGQTQSIHRKGNPKSCEATKQAKVIHI